MRYPYHNKIKRRIKRGEMVAFEFVEDYPGIGEALVLEFNTEPFIRPVRPHKYVEYVDLLVYWQRGEFNNAGDNVVRHTADKTAKGS